MALDSIILKVVNDLILNTGKLSPKNKKSKLKSKLNIQPEKYKSLDEELFLAIQELKETKVVTREDKVSIKKKIKTDGLEISKEINENSVAIKYSRLIEKIAYFEQSGNRALDYQKVWGYDNSSNHTFSASFDSSNNNGEQAYNFARSDESVGLLTDKDAQSVVERVQQMSRFGDLNRVSHQELERFRYWRLFASNKVLRRVWERDSGLFYRPPGQKPMMI
jgi:hypothetical protein